MKVEIKKLENSEVEITGEIALEAIEKHKEEAIKKLGKNINLDGFRKGHVPQDMILKEVGEQVLLEEMAQRALSEEFPKIIKEHKIDAIGQPEVTITKLAPGNPLGYKIKVSVMPEVTLPDYKKIAKKIVGKKTDAIEVSDKEIEKTISEIQKMRTNNVSPDKEGDKGETKKDEAPEELTDEFVKTLGDFKTVDDFKTKLKENIKFEKEKKAEEKKRLEMIDEIIKDTKMELPKILVDAEQKKMMFQFESDIANMGIKFEDYLTQIKKTKEEIMEDLKKDAIKRAKTQIILNVISEKEKITIPDDKIKEQVANVMKQYKDADEQRALIYVVTTMTNQKVFEFLEEQGPKKK